MSDPFADEMVSLLPRLRRFARALSGDTHQADDLVQAGCERAWTRRHQWQEGSKMDHWMFKIVKNLWIDHSRSAASRRELNDEDALAALPADDWDSAMETRLTLEQALTAMRGLPEAQRAVMAAVAVEGMSYQEAADVLEVPIGTVMSRLSAARKSLPRLMQWPVIATGVAP